MSDEAEITILIAAPADASNKVPGSRLVPCEACGMPSRIAPSGQRLKASDPRIRVLCWPCAKVETEKARKAGDTVQPAVTMSALKELAAWRKRN